MDYGIKIHRKDAPPYILNEDSTMMCLSGVSLNPGENTGIKVPEKYDYFSFLSTPIKFITYTLLDPDGYPYRVISTEEAVTTIDQNRIIHFKIISDVPSSSFQQLVVLSWIKNNQYSGYGLSFNGINNFAAITQDIITIPVVWKGSIFVTKDGWSIRNVDASLNYSNCFVLIYCNDALVSLGRNIDGVATNDIILKPFHFDGSVSQKQVEAKAVIFGLRTFSPANSKNGIEIYANNKVVYNSSEDILINPKMIDFSVYDLSKFTEIEGINRPLLCCSPIGAEVQDKGNGKIDIFSVGVRCDGNKIAAGLQKTDYDDSVKKPFNKRIISNKKYLVLDASDYFSFSSIKVTFSPSYISVSPDQSDVTVTYSVDPNETPDEAFWFSVPTLNQDYVKIDKANKKIDIKRNGLQLIYNIEVIDEKEESIIGVLPIEFRITNDININQVKFDPAAVIIPVSGTSSSKYEIIPNNANEDVIFDIPAPNKKDVTIDEKNKIITLKYNIDASSYKIIAKSSRSNKIVGKLSVSSTPHYLIKIRTYTDDRKRITASIKYPADKDYQDCATYAYEYGKITYTDGTTESIKVNKNYFKNKNGAYIKSYGYYVNLLGWYSGDYIRRPCAAP